ncbi:hypothetical protein [Brevibacillus massiliensis]|jgi:hypothetical protein|nr:hypothetical protein [Brevibacillus massiliensis]
MSLSMYVFYNWLVFLWGGAGMLFIAVVSIREIIGQLGMRRNRTGQEE